MVDRRKMQEFYAQQAAERKAKHYQRYIDSINKHDAYSDYWDEYQVPSGIGEVKTSGTSGSNGAKKTLSNGPKGKISDGLGRVLSDISGTLDTAWNNVESGKGIMPKYAKYARFLAAANAAAKASQGISNYSNAVSDTEQLVSDILASAGSNPNVRYALSADQLQLLRQLKNGTYDTSSGFSFDGLMNNLGNVAMGAGMGYITGGGTVGALLGALAPAAEGITSGMAANQGRITSELEGLYNALYEAEMRDKTMKRDAAMQRYANSIY